MNIKLIFQLSFFGLIMAVATVALIPQKFEPIFWLVIFAFSAYVIAKVCAGKYFLHGFLTALVNCLWVTIVHLLFYNSYATHHTDIIAMYGDNPKQKLITFAPVFGIASGLVLGLFAFIASKLVIRRPV